MRYSSRIGILILVILCCLVCLLGILAQYDEINQSYPGAKLGNYDTSCDFVETNLIRAPAYLSFRLYFGTHKCYVSSDNASQVELWYKKMGWVENKEDGGLIKDLRTNLFLINKTTFYRVFFSQNEGVTEIDAQIMISVDIFPR